MKIRLNKMESMLVLKVRESEKKYKKYLASRKKKMKRIVNHFMGVPTIKDFPNLDYVSGHVEYSYKEGDYWGMTHGGFTIEIKKEEFKKYKKMGWIVKKLEKDIANEYAKYIKKKDNKKIEVTKSSISYWEFVTNEMRYEDEY